MISYNPPRYLFRRHTIINNLQRGNNFLEIGAGNLKLSNDLSKLHQSGVILDFEDGVKKIYDSMPTEFKNNIEVIIGDFFKTKFNSKFDNIIACEVMEHIDEDLKFLKKIHSILSNNGSAIISVPAKQKYWTVHDDVVGHVRRYEKDQTISLFEAAGFKDITIHSYGFPFINLLWRLRALHGKHQAKTKKNWSKEKQTKQSGVSQIPKKYDFMGLFINKYTFYPLNLISTRFDKNNLSEGYVVFARK